MTTNFLKNLYLGSNLTDEELADIPHPRAELHTHVAYKMAEVGSILGMCVLGPLVGLVRGRSVSAALNAAVKGGKIGCGVGIPLAPVFTELAIRNATDDAVYDRSYRIRNNVGQVRTDRFATYGGVAGVGIASVAGTSRLTGVMLGIAIGSISAGIYNNQNK